MKKLIIVLTLLLCVLSAASFFQPETTYADEVSSSPSISLSLGGGEGNPQQTAAAFQSLLLVSIIALAPSILLMMTCFPRFTISLHFLRSALGTQQMPPNQVLVSLAIFLSVFMMRTEISEINENALKPFAAGQITQEQAVEEAMIPLRGFMVKHVSQKDINLFADMANVRYEKSDPDTIPNTVLIPAFMLSELSAGFKIGAIIFIPFIVIDMVVAATLMSMGMMMLPPTMISLPFKIILFVLADGWNLTIGSIFNAFSR